MPIICGIFWSVGGNLNKYWRRFIMPAVMCLVFWYSIHWQLRWEVLALYITLWLGTIIPYGDPDEPPRWLCGFLYGLSLLPLAYFSGQWFWFGANVAISTFMTWWLNDVSPVKDKSIKGWSVAEALTGLFAYGLFPLML